MVKNPPVMQETWVQSRGEEDPLEKEKTAYSSVLTWRIPWTEQPGELQPMGSQSRTPLSDQQWCGQGEAVDWEAKELRSVPVLQLTAYPGGMEWRQVPQGSHWASLPSTYQTY